MAHVADTLELLAGPCIQAILSVSLKTAVLLAALIPLLDDNGPTVRKWAVWALGAIGEPHARHH